jgi:hypothetical protein
MTPSLIWTTLVGEHAQMNKKESFDNIPCHVKVYIWYIPMPHGWKLYNMTKYSMMWHGIFCQIYNGLEWDFVSEIHEVKLMNQFFKIFIWRIQKSPS